MENLLTSEEMRYFDAETIKSGTSELELIKRASRSAKIEIDKMCLGKNAKILIVCGSGNNGADGYSLAEDLNGEYCVDVFSVSEPKSEGAKYYFSRLNKTYNLQDFASYDLIVDAMLGTGFKGEVTGKYEEVINKINNSGAKVMAMDIASGLNADNGIAKTAVKADLTVSFGALKLGHFLASGKDYSGKVVSYDVGIKTKSNRLLFTESDLLGYFPPKKQNIHKYVNGKVCIIGGSKNYIGAPLLALQAEVSLRCGAGLSTLVVPDSMKDAVKERILEQTLCVMPDIDGEMAYDEKELENAIHKAKAVVFGNGIGLGEDIKKILKHLLNKDINLLIDADGITVLSQNLDLLKDKKAHVILTPHAMEFSRLTGKGVGEIESNPVYYSESFAKKYGVVVALKGASSIVTDGENTRIIGHGRSSISKAGVGDTLAGIIGALLIRLDCFDAGVVGNGLLASCSSRLEEKYGVYSVIASDISKELPNVIKNYIG